MADEPRNQSRGRKGARWWLRRLGLALLAPTLFLLLLEGVLRLCGVGYPTAFLVRDQADPAKLHDNYQFAWRFFPPALARSPQPIRVAEAKPADTKRVILFGSSAAMGDPEPAYGMARILESLLAKRFPKQKWEVINLATTAINSHVALPMARDCRRLEADAWLFYMGNNEVVGPFGRGTVFGAQAPPLWAARFGLWSQTTAVGQLFSRLASRRNANVPEAWGGMEMFLEQQVRRDDPRLQRVYANFAGNLASIITLAKKQRVPVLLSTVPVNLRDSAPFVSVHREGLSAEEQTQWQSHFDQGCQAQVRQDWEAALAAFTLAESLDAEFAELAYRQGQCLLAAGQSAQAAGKFRVALEADALRFRANAAINQAIRAAGAGLVDSEQRLTAASPDKISGSEFFHEHVHLTFSGNYLVALGFAESLAKELAFRETGPWPSEAVCREDLLFTSFHEMEIVRAMRQRLAVPPFAGQADHAERDAGLQRREAELKGLLGSMNAASVLAKFQAKIAAHPEDWFSRKQLAALADSLGQPEVSVEQWRAISGRFPHYPAGFFQLGSQLNRLKRWPEAEAPLRQAVALREQYPHAWNSLGICRSHQADPKEAYACFEKAVRILPKYPEAYVNWGLVLANQGDGKGAVTKYEAAVKADPKYAAAHQQLAKFYSTAGDYAGADRHYAELARLAPQEPAAWINLGLARMKLKQFAEAIAALEQGLILDSNNAIARQALSEAERLRGKP